MVRRRNQDHRDHRYRRDHQGHREDHREDQEDHRDRQEGQVDHQEDRKVRQMVVRMERQKWVVDQELL